MTYTLPVLPAPAVPDIMEKSAETMTWLRQNIKVGYVSERGPAWWANGAITKDGTWDTIPDGSHFEGPVPMEEVRKLLDILHGDRSPWRKSASCRSPRIPRSCR